MIAKKSRHVPFSLTTRPRTVISSHECDVAGVACSFDGSLVFTIGRGRGMGVWTAPPTCQHVQWLVDEQHELGHTWALYCIAASPVDMLVAVGGGNHSEGEVRVWGRSSSSTTTPSLEMLRELQWTTRSGVLGVEFSVCGRFVGCIDYYGCVSVKHVGRDWPEVFSSTSTGLGKGIALVSDPTSTRLQVFVLNRDTVELSDVGEQETQKVMFKPQSNIVTLAWSPRHGLVGGTWGGDVMIWRDIKAGGKPTSVVKGNGTTKIATIAIFESLMATNLQDGVQLWTLDTAELVPLVKLPHPRFVKGVCFCTCREGDAAAGRLWLLAGDGPNEALGGDYDSKEGDLVVWGAEDW